ncbi:hypothetical protein FD27_GL000269 [Limosilactobacillus frumenti DSM 13145]|uniref:Uncharacterized protein n=1 Tax=Limosilactobacillus frumenti DSM 13145 TaxID=1423746 RepID=A0A0R1P6Z1_9LACO|nr:hypothetical protein FD27_GL000269 [Limosilactobacillus frumenti DSM 13145]
MVPRLKASFSFPVTGIGKGAFSIYETLKVVMVMSDSDIININKKLEKYNKTKPVMVVKRRG